MRRLLIIIFISWSLCLSAQIINIPWDYLTIQQGIEAASEGDTVLVDTGTFVERINFLGKNITLASKFLTSQDTNYISKTIINGDSLGTVVKIINGEDSTALICGFTIENGADSIGGGIQIINSSPKIKYSIITNNVALANGGGIYLLNSNAYISEVKINYNNTLGVSGNPPPGGGGLFSYGSSPYVVNSIIDNNTIIDDNTISSNDVRSNNFGGGVFMYESGGSIINCVISNNAVHSDDLSFGGGICSWRSSTTLMGLKINGNYIDFSFHLCRFSGKKK
jgi:hypothetical protein